MNNLAYFRKLAGLEAKQLAKMVDVTVHTYNGFEKNIMSIPFEVAGMLAMLYDITSADLFCEEYQISEEAIEGVNALGQMSESDRHRLFMKRLFDDEDAVIKYRNIKRLKDRLKNQPSE